MASESGFKTVWGFDPDDVEKAKQRVVPTGDFGNFGEKQSGDNFPNDQEVGIPFSFEAQVYELDLPPLIPGAATASNQK